MRVAVGCPIRDRAWIFPWWVQHVRAAFAVAGLKPSWVFVIGFGPDGDDNTFKLATDLYKEDGGMWCETHEPRIAADREWSDARYAQMAGYRNTLLDMVQTLAPDYFLSLDSDILIHPSALAALLETIQKTHRPQNVPTQFDAVGGKAFLSETSRHITTYGFLPKNGGIRRQDSDGVFEVEALMAMKLMNPAAYHIPYVGHRSGEDIGWSINCTNAGLRLGWDGRIASKHVMSPARLHKLDQRLGW